MNDHDISVPIGVLDNELDPGYRTIKRALEELEAHEFVARDENYTSYYTITERGRRYLDGELDASGFEADE
ncbi:hypothetical protein NGM10_09600 [Halorussus salilacus]|uniref:hypothetical protein n=1 Tax=Halorussus salilacus TaxID=2953750 RepID=UPI00209ECA7A|nr:hypothetical protein [Halorussus salilacus]USZ66984.1 hypothetical protein NGM10_09600 [Halorussus salilacus]